MLNAHVPEHIYNYINYICLYIYIIKYFVLLMNIHIYIYGLIIYICTTIFVCKSTVTLVQKKVNSIDMSLNPGHCEYYHVPVLTWEKMIVFLVSTMRFITWFTHFFAKQMFLFLMFGLERWLGTF